MAGCLPFLTFGEGEPLSSRRPKSCVREAFISESRVSLVFSETRVRNQWPWGKELVGRDKSARWSFQKLSRGPAGAGGSRARSCARGVRAQSRRAGAAASLWQRGRSRPRRAWVAGRRKGEGEGARNRGELPPWMGQQVAVCFDTCRAGSFTQVCWQPLVLWLGTQPSRLTPA